jgi:hypothetical protein
MASFVLAMSPFVVSHPIHSISVLHLPPRNIANKSCSHPVYLGRGKGEGGGGVCSDCDTPMRPCEKRTLVGHSEDAD